MIRHLIYTLNHWELKIGDLCEKGSQLRPHIVWFGEMVHGIQQAVAIVQKADIFVVVGTSLMVYPAASLLSYIKPEIPIFVVDPHRPEILPDNVSYIQEKAGKGMQLLKTELEKFK